MRRKVLLATGEIYHIFNRSISGYTIFNSDEEYLRMLITIAHYCFCPPKMSLSYLMRNTERVHLESIHRKHNNSQSVSIIGYCLMPNHYHLILKQKSDCGISSFVGNVQNSYSRYFNLRHNRKGPLWEGRFKGVHVESESQLIHLSRYVHLNPVTSRLVKKPEDWDFSSYGEYIKKEINDREGICQFLDIINMDGETYKDFVESRISYQKELSTIKHLMIDE